MGYVKLVITLVLCVYDVRTMSLPYYDLPPYYGGGDMYDGMSMNQCPMMDCSAIEWMLPCDWEDRYATETMMNGVMCETCRQCRDYTYFRSLLEQTISAAQDMYERALVMQAFLDDNRNILFSISELPDTVDVVDAFRGVLGENQEALHAYSMFETEPVVQYLLAATEKLALLLEGSMGEDMASVLDDYTRIRLERREESASQDIPMVESLSPIIQTLHMLINELSKKHQSIKAIIEEEAPMLKTLQALEEEEFSNLWENDRTTARVAFKLVENSKDAIEGLLSMNMDATASRLKMVNEESERILLTFWEGPKNDLIPSGNGSGVNTGEAFQNVVTNTDGMVLDEEGSGDIDDGHQINGVNSLTQESNLLFSWLQNKLMKNHEVQ